MKGDVIVRPCDRHSNETVTVRKHVTKYKNMRKLLIEFPPKIDNRGIKIARVNSIRITKSINLLQFCTVLGSFVIEGDFRVHSPFIQKSMLGYYSGVLNSFPVPAD